MRCPKCRYISFDEGDRCRNCGYDFSLIQPETPLDLPIRQDEPVGPMADLRLKVAQRRQAAAALTPPDAQNLSLRQGFDLPLFNQARDAGASQDDGVTTSRSSAGIRRHGLRLRCGVPRLRRSRPLPQRARGSRSLFGRSRRWILSTGRRWFVKNPPLRRSRAASGLSTRPRRRPPGSDCSGPSSTCCSSVGIDWRSAVFHAAGAGLRLDEVRLLPIVPMGAFLLLLNGGYLTMFTAAGGQTIGKMLAGTRVVAGRLRPIGRSGCPSAPPLSAPAACFVVAPARRSRILHGALPRRRPRAARRGRRHARHQSVTRLAVFIATVGYCGYFPFAPGTVGSAAGLVVYLLVWWTQSPVVEVPADRRASSPSASGPATERRTLLRRHRPGPGRDRRSARDAHHARVHAGRAVATAIAGFVLFRIFDVIKPFPAGRFERLHGGLGVMADDAMAAVYANLVAARLIGVPVARLVRMTPADTAALGGDHRGRQRAARIHARRYELAVPRRATRRARHRAAGEGGRRRPSRRSGDVRSGSRSSASIS